MAVYIGKKTAALIVTLLVVSALTFFAFSIVPGDPVTKMLGTEATPEREEELRSSLGLDRPVAERYVSWIRGFLGGDLGRSYSYSMPVSDMLSGKLPVTAALTGLSFLVIIIITLPAGIALAKYEGRAADRILGVFNQLMMSVPPMFLGVVFTAVFGLFFKLFTAGGFVSYSQSPALFFGYLFFPALAIALPRSAMAVKLLRSSIISQMREDYVRTAYSRGNSKWGVILKHTLRNAVIPLVAFLAMTLADIVAGSVIIEQIFAIPGLGRLLLSSISNRDYPVAQAAVVIIASIVVLVNFLADIAYQYIDPRIRIGS